MRKHLAAVAMCAASLGGCGNVAEHPADGVPPSFESGARLVAIYWETDDGLRSLAGWYDTKLDIPCDFGTAEDGVLRCLPRAFASGMEETVSTCACCSPKPRFVYTTPTQTVTDLASLYCTDLSVRSRQSIHELGAELSRTEASVTYAIGKVVDPAAFVGATLQHAPDGPRVATATRVADDGSRELVGFYDNELDAPCSPRRTRDGSAISCIATNVLGLTPSAIHYSDAACMSPVVFACGGAAPAFTPQVMTKGCSEVERLTTVGPRVDTSNLYTVGTDGCANANVPDTVLAYSLGPVVDPDPALDVALVRRGGRLRADYYVARGSDVLTPAPIGGPGVSTTAGTLIATGDTRVSGARFYDSISDQACSTPFNDETGIDGAQPCVPPAAEAFTNCPAFSAAMSASDCPATAPPLVFTEDWSSSACDRPKQYFEPVPLPASQIDPACPLNGMSLPGVAYDYFTPGTPVDAATFARVHLRRDTTR